MNSISSLEQKLGCAVIFYNEAGEILLGKRKNAYKAGYYGLPGGHLEVGEPLETCVAREVLEETGLTNQSFSFVATVREWQGSADFIHFLFAAPLSQAEVPTMEPEKCEGWEWFPLTALPELMIEGHRAGFAAWQAKQSLQDLPAPRAQFLA